MSFGTIADWAAVAAASAAACAAWLQQSATRKQTDASLIEKRFAIYRDFEESALSIASTNEVTIDNEQKMRRSRDLVAPLFGTEEARLALSLWQAAYWGQSGQLPPDLKVTTDEHGAQLGPRDLVLDIWEDLQPLLSRRLGELAR